jgi:hypothetical protein
MTNIEHNTVVALFQALNRLHEKQIELAVWKAKGQPGNIDMGAELIKDTEHDRAIVGACIQILEINY